MTRLVFFVKNITGFSYEASEWLVIGIIAAIVLVFGLAGWATLHQRRKARRAAQAAAPKPLAERFVDDAIDMFSTDAQQAKDDALDHLIHAWQAIGSPQTVAELQLTGLSPGRLQTAQTAIDQLLTFVRENSRSTPALRQVRKRLGISVPVAPTPEAAPTALAPAAAA